MWTPRQNFFLSFLSLSCLVLSLIVFYPLSMEIDKYNNSTLRIWAYSFYILQGISFTLAMVTFRRGVSLIRLKKESFNLLSFIIDVMVFAIFAYELYWFLKHI
jgi:hypothetical protein